LKIIKLKYFLAFSVLAMLISCSDLNESDSINNSMEKTMTKVTIKTSVGDIQLELNDEKAPITVENFKTIANSGYYEGTIFHRVINGFMVQGGGLTADMNNKSSGLLQYKTKQITVFLMIEAPLQWQEQWIPHSATGQFFINHKDNGFLNHTGENSQGWGYAVFGAVTEGMDVVDQIADVATGSSGGHQDVPVDAITIESVTISE
jgi:peptidyl-prolyl cis-trans isomerase B (cyclophilin B)